MAEGMNSVSRPESVVASASTTACASLSRLPPRSRERSAGAGAEASAVTPSAVIWLLDSRRSCSPGIAADEAIAAAPNEPLSWVARGLSRGELGDTSGASRDLAYAGELFGEQGEQEKAEQLLEASRKATAVIAQPSSQGGNGVGSQLLSGALSTAQALAPILLKAFTPMLP